MARTRVPLCGKLVVEIEGERVEEPLPGRQGRLLFAYLALNRNRTLSRDELLAALWPDGRNGGLAPLLSKLRRLLPLNGLQLRLPADAWIDVEAAVDAVHRAESAVAQGDFHRAWAPAQVAMFVSRRPFLPGNEGEWTESTRRSLAEVELRALEAYAQAGLGIGGTELAAAVRCGRELSRREPTASPATGCSCRRSPRKATPPRRCGSTTTSAGCSARSSGVAPSAITQELHRLLLA